MSITRRVAKSEPLGPHEISPRKIHGPQLFTHRKEWGQPRKKLVRVRNNQIPGVKIPAPRNDDMRGTRQTQEGSQEPYPQNRRVQQHPALCASGRLFLALYDPFAMLIAQQHVLGEFECKIGVETFDGSIAPSLVAYAAGIHLEALLFPALVPGTLRRLAHASVFGRFNNFEHKFGTHGSLSHEMCDRFQIAGGLRG